VSLLDAPFETNWRAYHRATRSATYGFLAALPLVLAYEVLIGVVNLTRPFSPVRLGAESWLKMLLPAPLGLGLIVLLAMLAIIGAIVFYLEWDRRIPLRPRYFALLIGESALYAFVVAVIVSSMVAVLFAAAASPAAPLAQVANRPGGILTQLALSIGAGVYEELLFRVLLVGGLAMLFRRLMAQKRYAYTAAAIVGALLFSAAHYTGLYGDAFGMSSFSFRFLFGLALNGIFLVRGFAVAAWTHALYDVMIVTGFIG
jgi:membrane protease YdiL (CAAX protease family)